MEKQRLHHLDVLRAIAILGVIVIHVLTYNLTNPFYIFTWNYLQFVVTLFVFCSAYISTQLYEEKLQQIGNIILWFRKRIIRLLVPFYLYLIAHYALFLLFPQYVSGLGLQKSFSYAIDSVLLIGGTNLNWLPLLFLQSTLLFPFLLYALKRKIILMLYFLFASIITLWFTIQPFSYQYYRFVMWIPWSLLFIASMLFAMKDKQIHKHTSYVLVGSISFISFFLLQKYFFESGRSLTIYDHKYPPDFYYLFYTWAITCFAIPISKLTLFQQPYIQKACVFLSKNSYPLFFVHYIFLDVILKLGNKNPLFMHSPLQFIVILTGSILVCFFLDKTKIFSSLLK